MAEHANRPGFARAAVVDAVGVIVLTGGCSFLQGKDAVLLAVFAQNGVGRFDRIIVHPIGRADGLAKFGIALVGFLGLGVVGAVAVEVGVVFVDAAKPGEATNRRR